jgi:hypothetical protein
MRQERSGGIFDEYCNAKFNGGCAGALRLDYHANSHRI